MRLRACVHISKSIFFKIFIYISVCSFDAQTAFGLFAFYAASTWEPLCGAPWISTPVTSSKSPLEMPVCSRLYPARRGVIPRFGVCVCVCPSMYNVAKERIHLHRQRKRMWEADAPPPPPLPLHLGRGNAYDLSNSIDRSDNAEKRV